MMLTAAHPPSMHTRHEAASFAKGFQVLGVINMKCFRWESGEGQKAGHIPKRLTRRSAGAIPLEMLAGDIYEKLQLWLKPETSVLASK